MTLIKPFRALRPASGRAAEVLAPPYDVVSSAEARELAKGKPWSFLHISKPEIDLDPGTDPYDKAVYAKAAENLTLKEFRCSDLGQKCSWHYIAQTEELIVDGVAIHAREAHGIKDFTQEMKVKVENSLRPWNG